MLQATDTAAQPPAGEDDLAGRNAAIRFVDRHLMEGRGDKTAFIEADGAERSLTYGELAEQSDRMAALYRRHGIAPEQRALMLVHDTIEFPIVFWGSLKAGIVPVPLNTLLSGDVYATIALDSRATALFVSAPLLEEARKALAAVPGMKVFVIGADGRTDGFFDFTTELAASEPEPAIERGGDDQAFWLYSSGSTGLPKGVRHVHSALGATADTYGAQVLQIAEDDVVHSAAKLFFAYGLGNAMTFPMSVGATTVLWSARPTPDSIFAVFRDHRPTVFCGVPTLFAALLSKMDEQPEGTDRLRRSISAGEALPEQVGRRWKELIGTDILDGVGSTEMLHIFLSNRPDDVAYGTSGQAVPGYELRLIDEHGAEVGTGEVGELLVRGASAADGYWNQRQKSRGTFVGEWTHTGDKYEKRDNGRLVYCGRTDDMFKVSGIWVSPFEIESALVSHPDVLEAAVVAHRDADDLEKPKAYVVLKDGASSDGLDMALKEHVKAAIGKWKYPRWVVIVDDLPKTATGKIQRFKLREQEAC